MWMMCRVKIVEWILGPAEKLLASQTDIGDSFTAADELRKQHEQLELKCTVSTRSICITQCLLDSRTCTVSNLLCIFI